MFILFCTFHNQNAYLIAIAKHVFKFDVKLKLINYFNLNLLENYFPPDIYQKLINSVDVENILR